MSSCAKQIEVYGRASLHSESSDRHIVGGSYALESKGTAGLEPRTSPPSALRSVSEFNPVSEERKSEDPVVDDLGKRFENAAKMFESVTARDCELSTCQARWEGFPGRETSCARMACFW